MTAATALDDLFRRFGKAFNKGDADAVAACVTDDFEWRLNEGPGPTGHIVKGRDGLKAEFARRAARARNVRFSEARMHYAGEAIFGTFRMTGEQADGKPIDVYGIDYYVVRDGLIALKDSYVKAVG